MLNTKDIEICTDNINFLVVGDVGTGKSVFASSFPTPGYLFDFDKQSAVYRGKDFDYSQYPITSAGWLEFDQEFNKIMVEHKYKSIILDSTTSLKALALERAMAVNPKRNEVGGALWNVHYQLVKNLVDGVIRKLLSYQGYKAIIAHVKLEKDEETGAILAINPSLPGDLAEVVPAYCGEVLYSQQRVINGNKEYILLTESSGLYHARSNLSGKSKLLPAFVPNDFNSIMTLLKQRSEALQLQRAKTEINSGNTNLKLIR